MIYYEHSVDHWPWAKKDLQVCALKNVMAIEGNKKEEEMKKGEEKEDTKGEEKKEEEKGVVKDNEARSHASHALLVKVILIFPPCFLSPVLISQMSGGEAGNAHEGGPAAGHHLQEEEEGKTKSDDIHDDDMGRSNKGNITGGSGSRGLCQQVGLGRDPQVRHSGGAIDNLDDDVVQGLNECELVPGRSLLQRLSLRSAARH